MGKIIELPIRLDIDTDLVLDQHMTSNLALNPAMVAASEYVLRNEKLADEASECVMCILEAVRGKYHVAAVLNALLTAISVISANVIAATPGKIGTEYKLQERDGGVQCVTPVLS